MLTVLVQIQLGAPEITNMTERRIRELFIGELKRQALELSAKQIEVCVTAIKLIIQECEEECADNFRDEW